MLIHLFTDFGYQGPYVGELKAVFSRAGFTGNTVIDLMHDAPVFDPFSSAYLLFALSNRFQPGDACLAVVDPGVGSETRLPIIVKADGVMYCGPENGLFSLIINNAETVEISEITWRPDNLSTSFHGRDMFAPSLCKALNNEEISLKPLAVSDTAGRDWPAELARVIYIDNFGNLVTGLQGKSVPLETIIGLGERKVEYAETFSMRQQGEPFWFINSMGLVEIAVNQARADEYFTVKTGVQLSVITENR